MSVEPGYGGQRFESSAFEKLKQTKAIADENKSQTIWELTTQMDELRNLKSECADNLWIADSAKFLKWMTWYCDSWDAEIIELREKVNQLSKKSYEGLM